MQKQPTRLDELAAANAYHLGRKAGLGFLSIGLNPYPAGSAERAEWDRGWHSGNANRCADAERRLRATKFLCRYEKGECSPACGGRGFCLDVA